MNRVGFGFDLHPLVACRPLVLVGVTVPAEVGLDGHSDADPRYRGISSLLLLGHVMTLVRERGATLVNVDGTVLAQAPRLAPHLPEMAKRLADVLGIPTARVSVKAKSPEGLGLVGRREGIAAMAVVSLDVSE